MESDQTDLLQLIDQSYAFKQLMNSYINFGFNVRINIGDLTVTMFFCPICRKSFSLNYIKSAANHNKCHKDTELNRITEWRDSIKQYNIGWYVFL